MDQITHKFVQVNGLKLHVAEIGSESSPAVLLLHGFPEIWYSWRHQMIALANAGYRAIAPDYRGFGLSDAPAEPEKAAFSDLLSDTVGILDSLAISKAFVFGKDFGAAVVFPLALLHPQRVVGVITINMPFMPPGAFTEHFVLPEGSYLKRWEEPGRAEADFGRFDIKTVVRKIYIMFCQCDMPIASENQEVMDLVESSAPLPSWLTEEDIETYGALYEKNGFSTPLQVPYRSMAEVGSEVKDPKLEVPTLAILGEDDYTVRSVGIDEYVKSGEIKKYVPNQEAVFVPNGCHFVQEQFPEKVNQIMLAFLDRNKHLA